MFELPLFPLNTILFPGMPVHLRIFEPRYLQLVQDCLLGNKPFGVVLIREGAEALGPLPAPHLVGTTARIIQMEKEKDDQVYITGLGDERFRIHSLSYSKSYLVGQVEILPFTAAPLGELTGLVGRLDGPVRRYLELISDIGQREVDLTRVKLPEDPLINIYLAASLVHIPAVEKMPLLEADSATALVEALQRIYRREVSILQHTRTDRLEDVRRAAMSN